MRSPSSPVVLMCPSPPFAPSSLERKKRFGIGLTGALPSFGESTDQAGGAGAPIRKRYSSSFGHRYTAAAGSAGSEGSAGSGEKDPGALSGRVGLGRERQESEHGAVSKHLELPPLLSVTSVMNADICMLFLLCRLRHISVSMRMTMTSQHSLSMFEPSVEVV